MLLFLLRCRGLMWKTTVSSEQELQNKPLNKYCDADIVFLTPLHMESEDAMIKENGIQGEIALSGYVKIIFQNLNSDKL